MRHVTRSLAALTLALALGSPAVAQDERVTDPFAGKARKQGRVAAPRPRPRKPAPRPAASRPDPQPKEAQEAPQLVKGSARWDVPEGATSTTIRMGLAVGGVTLVEFPASDAIYSTHPADEDLVTLDESPRKTDPLVLRPGKGFAPGTGKVGAAPAATVTFRMESGLLVILQVYPVRDLTGSASRIVLSYDRLRVAAARAEEGLATNLAGAPPSPPPPAAQLPAPTRAAVVKATESLYNPAAVVPASAGPRAVVDVPFGRPAGGRPAGARGLDALRPEDLARALEPVTHDELTKVIEKPSKHLGKWSETVHGLQVATAEARDLSAKLRLVVFAVRNVGRQDVRLVEGQPEIYVETLDGENRPINLEHLRKARVETTAVERLIPAGRIVYYACVFWTPVLGVRQRMRVSVSSMAAADEPAAADLTTKE